jgi:outer membrane protein
MSNAAAAGIDRAEALTRPGLELRGSTAFDSDFGYSGGSADASYSYALGLNVPLYRGGSGAAVVTAKAEHRVSLEAAADRRVAVAYEIAISLTEVRRLRETLAVLDKQQRALSGLRGEISQELAAGAASRVDLDDTDRQLARLAVLRETTTLSLTRATTALRRLGIAEQSPPPDLSKVALGENKRALVELALDNNPRIRQSLALVDVATSRVDEAKGALHPSIDAQFELYGDDVQPGGGIEAPGARATLEFSLPLDLNGAGKATVEQRSAERLASEYSYQAALDGVTAAVSAAYDSRRQARQLRALAQKEVDTATALLAGMQAERKVGERSARDELGAIENLSAAQLNLATARYELRVAEYALAAETGLIVKLFETTILSAAL